MPRKEPRILLIPALPVTQAGRVTGRLVGLGLVPVIAASAMPDYYCLFVRGIKATTAMLWVGFRSTDERGVKVYPHFRVKGQKGYFCCLVRVQNSICHRGEAMRRGRGEAIVMAASETRTFCHSCIDCRRPPAAAAAVVVVTTATDSPPPPPPFRLSMLCSSDPLPFIYSSICPTDATFSLLYRLSSRLPFTPSSSSSSFS